MHYPALTLALTTLLTAGATSIPSNPYSHHLQSRGFPGGVYICSGERFTGDCAWLRPSSQCQFPLVNTYRPKSLGPDWGGICFLYDGEGCTGKTVTPLEYPGLPFGLPNYKSMKCQPKEGMSLEKIQEHEQELQQQQQQQKQQEQQGEKPKKPKETAYIPIP